MVPDIPRQPGRAAARGAERAAINAPMQGTAADLIKLAMIAVQNWLDEAAHGDQTGPAGADELVLEVPDAEVMPVRTHLPRADGRVAQLAVPIVVEVGVGANWEAAH